jgi:hypothetical protein
MSLELTDCCRRKEQHEQATVEPFQWRRQGQDPSHAPLGGQGRFGSVRAARTEPSLFYQWQKAFFENGNRAFEGGGAPGNSGTAEHKLQKQIHALEARLQRKHEVLSELMEEHIRLKNELGES